MQVHMKKNLFSASFYAKFYSLKISFIANYKIALIVKRMSFLAARVRLFREVKRNEQKKERRAYIADGRSARRGNKKTAPKDGLDYGATRLISRGNIEHSFTLAIPKKHAVIRSRPIAKPP